MMTYDLPLPIFCLNIERRSLAVRGNEEKALGNGNPRLGETELEGHDLCCRKKSL